MIGRLKDMVRNRNGEWVISFTTREDFGDLAGLALKDACMADNLYTPSADEVISVYENAWTGK